MNTIIRNFTCRKYAIKYYLYLLNLKVVSKRWLYIPVVLICIVISGITS